MNLETICEFLCLFDAIFHWTLIFVVALQLENYAKTEEAKIEELIKAVADSGAKVIVSGGAVGEMALHFCERYKYIIFHWPQFLIMILRYAFWCCNRG